VGDMPAQTLRKALLLPRGSHQPEVFAVFRLVDFLKLRDVPQHPSENALVDSCQPCVLELQGSRTPLMSASGTGELLTLHGPTAEPANTSHHDRTVVALGSVARRTPVHAVATGRPHTFGRARWDVLPSDDAAYRWTYRRGPALSCATS
jgi:hypothetical protein